MPTSLSPPSASDCPPPLVSRSSSGCFFFFGAAAAFFTAVDFAVEALLVEAFGAAFVVAFLVVEAVCARACAPVFVGDQRVPYSGTCYESLTFFLGSSSYTSEPDSFSS